MENKKPRKKTGRYIIGSIVAAVGTFIAMPKIIDYLSSKMYDSNVTPEDDDDWGPEIVPREKAKEDNLDGKL